MDGLSKAASASSPMQHLTLRVEHDCPMAHLSRQVPGADFHAWSGHKIEVVEVRCQPAVWAQIVELAAPILRPLQVMGTKDGGLLVWEPAVAASRSISRILESHGLIWLQPMRIRQGWEHYDAIAFAPGSEKQALAALSGQWPTQVVRRRRVGPNDLSSSLFLSLGPILDSPTPRQVEALVAAEKAGYYRSPRGATTAEVAALLGIGRSAFEERLRGGENRIISQVSSALEHHREQNPAAK